MKTFIPIIGVIAALPVVMAFGQSDTTTTTTTSTTYVPTTTVVGSRVVGAQGEEVGQISDVVLDKQTGCMAYVVLATTEPGGTRKTVAAPWTIFTPGADVHTYTVRVDKQKIYSAPAWESSRIEEYSRPEWIGNIYSYYGVQPGVGVGVKTNVSAREERREREQTNVERRTMESTPSQNRDMRVRPPHNPRERASETSATSTEAGATTREKATESTTTERHHARTGRTHEGASPTPSTGEATAETPHERAEHREPSGPGQETAPTSATPEAGKAQHREPSSESHEAATTPGAGAEATAPPPHQRRRAKAAESKPEASPTP